MNIPSTICRINPRHIKIKMRQEIPKEYKPKTILQTYLTRKFICPNAKENRRIKRIKHEYDNSNICFLVMMHVICM